MKGKPLKSRTLDMSQISKKETQALPIAECGRLTRKQSMQDVAIPTMKQSPTAWCCKSSSAQAARDHVSEVTGRGKLVPYN